MTAPRDTPPVASPGSPLRVAESIVAGLASQPILLTLVVLNLVGIGAALWFLHELGSVAQARTTHLLQLLQQCMERKP